MAMQSAPKYKARTYIEVLPAIEKDPLAVGSAPVAKDVQYAYRLSMARLMQQQSTLGRLIDGDKIRETEWFKRFGGPIDEAIRGAYRDLRKHFRTRAHRHSNFIEVSMTCRDKKESALIVNEMVDLFLREQANTKKVDIIAKLTELEQRRDSIQRGLDAAEKALADVRETSGFTDLEERSYPHPIVARLVRLELERDNCILRNKEMQADIENLKRRGKEPNSTQAEEGLKRDIQNAQDSLIVLQSRLEELEKMRQEASAKKRELDLARQQYYQRLRIRDERIRMLDSLKGQIERLRILAEDPETAKVKFVGYAPEPLEPDTPRWESYLPGGAVLGFVLGILIALVSGKPQPKKE
jgi:uncharacterized protein involved in exopolysaccharide biosynthesis